MVVAPSCKFKGESSLPCASQSVSWLGIVVSRFAVARCLSSSPQVAGIADDIEHAEQDNCPELSFGESPSTSTLVVPTLHLGNGERLSRA